MNVVGTMMVMVQKGVKMNKALDELSSLGEELESSKIQYEADNDAWWNSLTEQERQDAFYAVVKRIHKGELVDRGTFRYILYDVFGFGPEMYMPGVDCGFMALHNSIYTPEEMRELRDRELASLGIKPIVTKIELDS